MSLLNTFTNITKSAIALAVTPVMIVADILTLPSSAYNNSDPFKRTSDALRHAGDAFGAAVKEVK